MADLEKIKELIDPHLLDMGFELVRLKWTGTGKYSTLQIMAEPVDHDKLMTVEDCERISVRVSALLDVEDVIKSRYQLEVSSPGLDRPLTREHDFERFKGNLAKIETNTPIDDRKKFKGRLLGISPESVIMLDDETKGGQINIPFHDVVTAEMIWENPNAPKPKKGKKK